MRLDFFPSRTLTLYLVRLFIARILAVLVMLVLVLQLLDMLGESGKILAVPGNGDAQLWYYVSLRAPQLVSTFLPYSVLLATLITFVTLNQNSEVISMRGAGLSAHQILAPMLATALAVSAVSFAFNEGVVTRSTATLKAWQNVNYGHVPKDSGSRSNLYLADGPDILFAETVEGSGDATQLYGVTYYRRDASGTIVSKLTSPHAKLGDTVVAPGIFPRQIAISNVDGDAQDIFTLTRSIAALRDSGRRTAELEGKWWHKISGPLAALLMPLLGAVAAFGLARSGKTLIRAVIGMALGFGFFVIDNAALALGNFGAYPPLVAAWGPFLLFLLVGETVLIRTEE
jgi:lipopolysaccharide export system permease protein